MIATIIVEFSEGEREAIAYLRLASVAFRVFARTVVEALAEKCIQQARKVFLQSRTRKER